MPLIAQTQVKREVGTNFEVVLNKERPKSVVDRVVRVSVTLGVAADVCNIVEIGRAFAVTQGLRAGVIDKLA